MNKFFSLLRYLIKVSCQNKLFSYIYAFIIIIFIKKLNKHSRNNINIIIFSEKRWKESVEIIKNKGRINLFKIPNFIFNQINSLFRAKINFYSSLNRPFFPDIKGIVLNTPKKKYYYLMRNEYILKERKKHSLFISQIAKILKKFLKIRSGLSCSIYYRQEQEWIRGFYKGGVPFIALHKEHYEYGDTQLKLILKKFKDIKMEYPGTGIILPNKNMAQAFKKSDLFPNTKISSSGVLKYDNLLRNKRKNNKKKKITLFSFGHILSGIEPKNIENTFDKNKIITLFSKKNNEGFSKLFFNVHRIFIESAIKYKNINFYIKPRINEPWWIEKIEEVALKVTGKKINQIRNLTITKKPATYLINSSINVIGFNSTVLIESIAMGLKPILPIFDEAGSNYSEYVFFKKYLNNFYVPRSHQDFCRLIKLCVQKKKGFSINKSVSKEFLQRYIKYDKSVAIKNTIKEIKLMSSPSLN